MAGRFTKEQMMTMDPIFLRAHLRERVHHTIEHQLIQAMYGARRPGPTFGDIVREILEVWEARGLPSDWPDVKWAQTIFNLAEKAKSGQAIEIPGGYMPQALTEEQMKTWNVLLYGRRSYRHWDDRPVPRWMVEKILEAGMWAPSACNLQICRFIVMEDPEVLQLFANREFEVEKVKIVVCADIRAYRDVEWPPPERNKYLDVGACLQNMALATHALGLGGCWSTFNAQQIDGIRRYYGLPDHLEVVTYLSLGWPAEKVMPPSRMAYTDALLAWSCQK